MGLIEKKAKMTAISKWYQIDVTSTNGSALNNTAPIQQANNQTDVSLTNSSAELCARFHHSSTYQEPNAKRPRIAAELPRLETEKVEMRNCRISILETLLSLEQFAVNAVKAKLTLSQKELDRMKTANSELRRKLNSTSSQTQGVNLESHVLSTKKLSDQFKLEIAEKNEQMLRKKIKILEETKVSDELQLKRAKITEENAQNKIRNLEEKVGSITNRYYQERKVNKQMEKEKHDICAQCSIDIGNIKEQMEENEVMYKEKITKLTDENLILKSTLPALFNLLKALKEQHYEMAKDASELSEKFRSEIDQMKKNTIENVELKFTSLRGKFEKQRQLIEKQKCQHRKSETKTMKLSQKMKSLEASTTQLLAKLKHLQNEKSRLETLIREQNESMLELQQQNAQQQKQIEQDRSQSDVQINELKVRNATLRQRINHLLMSLQSKDQCFVEKQDRAD